MTLKSVLLEPDEWISLIEVSLFGFQPVIFFVIFRVYLPVDTLLSAGIACAVTTYEPEVCSCFCDAALRWSASPLVYQMVTVY